MPFDRFIPSRISNVSPHHRESTACYHCEEEKIEGCEPTVHIRLPCFTRINIHETGGRLLHWRKRQAMTKPNGDQSFHPATTRAVLRDSQRSRPPRPLWLVGIQWSSLFLQFQLLLSAWWRFSMARWSCSNAENQTDVSASGWRVGTVHAINQKILTKPVRERQEIWILLLSIFSQNLSINLTKSNPKNPKKTTGA